VPVTISVGLALSTEFPNCTIEELMHAADMALYEAKAAGRNCVRVAQPPDTRAKVEEQPKETRILTP
jgi:PleD family two-component response regulator